MSGLDMFEDTFVEDEQYPRRHPVRRFFFRLFLVLVLLVCAGVVYVWRYQPLTYGDTYGFTGDDMRETESVGGSSVVPYGPGGSFEMVFSIRNTGRVSVRITSVPDGDLAPVLATYDVSIMPRRATAYDENDAQPFEPFTLRPHETRLLNLSYTFDNCGDAATAGNRTVRRQVVRYELVQGLRRVAAVRLVQPLVITGMPSC